MLRPEELQHNFDVEELVDEFVIAHGGELVRDLVPASPDFANADYLFREQNVLIELKSLQEDFALPEKLNNKIVDLWKKWASEGIVSFRMIFNPNELPPKQLRLIQRLYSEPIRRVLKKANRQLRETSPRLGLQDTRNLILIANNGLYSLEPDFVIATIARLLRREFSSIHGFIYFTVNRYVEYPQDEYEYAHHLWVPAYSDGVPSGLVAFVDDLGTKWFDFYGSKIGGWTGPSLKSDDRSVLRGVRNIRPKN